MSKANVVESSDWRMILRGGIWLRFIPVVALAVFGTLFIRHISALEGAAIWAAVTGLALWQWAAALICTALSFRAIGIYDILVHRVLNTGQTSRAARAAGVKAIALSQTLGFGAVTSALVRWRCLPDMKPAAVLKLSAVVSLSFLAALAAITALVVPLSGLVPRSGALISGGLAALAALTVLARLAHHLGWIPAPVGGKTLLALIAATAADTTFAALALWVLWPDALPFHLLFAAYLVALGAGLMSNAPGGVGAFDLTLLALLGMTDNAQAMAALLAFRVIYYALPAALALLGLLRVPSSTPILQPTHPESALLQQSARSLHHAKGSILTLPCWGAGAVLGDLPAAFSLDDLSGRNSPVAFYKCSRVQAVMAKRAGWSILRCAQEAWINPSSWTTDGPPRRQLRRALKTFDTSGLTIRDVSDAATLTPIANEWAKSHGGEKGHSMGRFCPDYLTQQRVFAAYDGNIPVAFVSFHTGADWTLDLMRHVDDIPNGTMHALVHAGITAACQNGVTRLSLAAVPAPAPDAPFAAKITKQAIGLRRFKSAFGPHWQNRYICARGPIRLALSMATLAYRIHRPAPLPRPNAIHAKHEDYSFAPLAPACEAISIADGARHYDHDTAQRPF